MDNVIKKIVLQLGEKEITLDCEEAKKLKAALDELFGREIIKEVHRDWWIHPHYPSWIDYPIPKIYVQDYPPQTVWSSHITGGCNTSFETNTMTLKVA